MQALPNVSTPGQASGCVDAEGPGGRAGAHTSGTWRGRTRPRWSRPLLAPQLVLAGVCLGTPAAETVLAEVKADVSEDLAGGEATAGLGCADKAAGTVGQLSCELQGGRPHSGQAWDALP